MKGNGLATEFGAAMLRKLFYACLVLFLLCVIVVLAGAGGAYSYVKQLEKELPPIMEFQEYQPRRVSEVFAKNGDKIGEFFREVRIPTPYEKIPKRVIQAFLAAEDDKFFEHKGINFHAIVRAAKANYQAGRTVQGGSTITQQVAKSFFLSPEKKLTRKIKEALLAHRLEKKLSKGQILYLYLNQIFFGEQSYGVAAAAQTYFRKSLDQLTLAEAALLAGLPQAPSRYSPIRAPHLAKDRQRYVLKRMAEVGSITKDQANEALAEVIPIYMEREVKQVAPFFVETVRQLLVQELGETAVLDGGIKVYTSLNLSAQLDAEERIRDGLKALDKRRGYRGPIRTIRSKDEAIAFLLETRRKLEKEKNVVRHLGVDGKFAAERPLSLFRQKDASGQVVGNLPPYLLPGASVEALVTEVYDGLGLVKVRFAESQGLMDIGDMGWARKPNAAVYSKNAPKVTRASQIVKPGDVVLVNVKATRFSSSRLGKLLAAGAQGLPRFNEYAYVALDQHPAVEGALLTIDQKSQDVVAMVGGYDFERSKFNRALQAQRQTGSSFKPIIYLAALDKGWNPARTIPDAPIVLKMENPANEGEKWKPKNHDNKFEGDVLMRRALAESMNIPTVKILEDIGIRWVVDYSRRLGIFSPMNEDLSLALGSSGITLYEMTKTFSQVGRLGKRTRPIVIHKILDHSGKRIRDKITLDKRFQKELATVERPFEERRKALGLALSPGTVLRGPASEDAAQLAARDRAKFYFPNPDQLIRPTSAYLLTSLLQATIWDENATAAKARALGRPVAGKTGTTDTSFDTWFIGYTTDYATGVWIGFDDEQTLGIGESGGHTALPLWVDYMKSLHEGIPPSEFIVPEGIVFAKIDKKTGKLAGRHSKGALRQAFLRGTEPKEVSGATLITNAPDFYKEDFN